MPKRIILSFFFLITLITAYTQTIKLRQLEWAPGANYCITTDANGIQYYTLDCPGLLDTVYYVPDTLIIVQETDTIRILIRDLDTDKQRVDTFRILGHELQLSLERDSQAVRTVDLTPYLDNTDNQYIDTLLLVGNELRISLFGDERAYSSILLPVYTDKQRVDTFQIVGHQLQLSLERDSQAIRTVDLTPYLEDNYVDAVSYASGTLTLGRTGILADLTTTMGDFWRTHIGDRLPGLHTDTIYRIKPVSIGTSIQAGVLNIVGNIGTNQGVYNNIKDGSFSSIVSGMDYNFGFGYQNYNAANSPTADYNFGAGNQNLFTATNPYYNVVFGNSNGKLISGSPYYNFIGGNQNIDLGNPETFNTNFVFGSNNIRSLNTGYNAFNLVTGSANAVNLNTISYSTILGQANADVSTGTIYASFIAGFSNLGNGNFTQIGYSFVNGQENIFNSSGTLLYNFVNGYQNLYNANAAGHNFANGYQNLYLLTSGDYNFANGRQNLNGITTGLANSAAGYQNGYLIGTSALANTLFGYRNIRNSTSASTGYNTFFGWENGFTTTGVIQYSTAFGSQNLYTGTANYSFFSGRENFYHTTSNHVVFGAGYRVAYNATDLSANNVIGIGDQTLINASSLDNVTALGWKAGTANAFANVTLLGDTAVATAARQFAVSNYYQTAKLKNYLFNIDQDTTNKDYFPLAMNAATKEIELRRMYLDTFELVSNKLRISMVGDGVPYQTVDLSAYSGTDTDDQYVDTFNIVSNKLRLSLDGDGRGYSEVDLSPYVGSDTDNQFADTFAIVGNLLRLSLDGDGLPYTTVDLTPYLDNTDAQTLSWNSGTRLLSISAGNSVTIDDNDNYVESATYNAFTGVLTLDRTGVLADINTSVLDHDWYKELSNNLAGSINDNIYTNGSIGINVNSPLYTIHALGRFSLFDAAQNYVNGSNIPSNNTGGKNWISGEGNMTSSTGAHMNFIAGYNNFPNAGTAYWNTVIGWLNGGVGNFSGILNKIIGIENADNLTTGSHNDIEGQGNLLAATTASTNLVRGISNIEFGNPNLTAAIGQFNLPYFSGTYGFAHGNSLGYKLASGNSVFLQGNVNMMAATSALRTFVQGAGNADSLSYALDVFIQGSGNFSWTKSKCINCFAQGAGNFGGSPLKIGPDSIKYSIGIGKGNFSSAGVKYGARGIGEENLREVSDNESYNLTGIGTYNGEQIFGGKNVVLLGDSLLIGQDNNDDSTSIYTQVIGFGGLSGADAVDTVIAIGLYPGVENDYNNVALIGTNATATRRSQFAIGEYESAKLRNYQFNIDQDTTGKTNWVLRLKASGEIELDEPEGQSRSYWNDTTGVLIVNIDTMDLDNRYQWNLGAAGDYTLIGDQPNPENVNFVGTGGITASRSGNTITLDGAALGNTDLTWSGAGPYTLNSSSGTDVTVTALSGIILSGTSTNLNVSGAGLQWNLGANASYTLIGDAGSAENVNFTGSNGIAASRSGNTITMDGNNTGWNVWVNSSFRNFMSYNDGLDFIAGSGINIGYTFAASGGNMTITNTGDLSNTNEGSLSVSTGTSTTSIINSNTSGSASITLQAGSNITLSESGNVITIAATSSTYSSWALWVQGSFVDDITNGEVVDIAVGSGMTTGWNGTTLTLGVTDQSITNEGRLGVGAGVTGTATLTTNTSGSNAVTFSSSVGINIDESTSTNGGQINIHNTGYLQLTTGNSTFFTLSNLVEGEFGNNIIVTGGLSVSVGSSGNSGAATIDGSLASDARIKKEVRPVQNPYELINALNPVTFKYTDDWLQKMDGTINNDHNHYSFIAQELQKVLPDNVYTSAHQLDGENILSITTDQVSVITTAAVKQLIQDLQEMQKKIESLEKELRRRKEAKK